jgi:predicted metal-dependent phosphoesterase TrpH
MLKADLHIHTKEDPCDYVSYSAKSMIKYKAKLGFNVIAITNHNSICFSKELQDYAKRLGIILIPGLEALIQGKEVLVLNADKTKVNYLEPSPEKKRPYYSLYKSFDILDQFKAEQMLIGAPHPYYLKPNCLGKDLEKHIELFDFIEYSHFYLPWLNKNKIAVKVAKHYNKPLLATTDSHSRSQLRLKNYSLIDAEPKIDDILEAIRKGKLKIVTRPTPLPLFCAIGARATLGVIANTLRQSKTI